METQNLRKSQAMTSSQSQSQSSWDLEWWIVQAVESLGLDWETHRIENPRFSLLFPTWAPTQLAPKLCFVGCPED